MGSFMPIGCHVKQTSLEIAVAKLASAVERAGFTLEQMIELLNGGFERG
jgi:hypothetical protein